MPFDRWCAAAFGGGFSNRAALKYLYERYQKKRGFPPGNPLFFVSFLHISNLEYNSQESQTGGLLNPRPSAWTMRFPLAVKAGEAGYLRSSKNSQPLRE